MSSGTTTAFESAFGALSGDALDMLRSVARRCSYPPQTVLCRQGELEHTLYIIVEGHVLVTQQFDRGEERLLGVIGPGGSFGEMALIDNSPRMATCTTMTQATVLEVTEEVFDKLVEENPAVAFTITRRILATARKNDHLAITDLIAKNEALQQAYAELQTAQAQLVQKERLEHELELAAEVQRHLLPGDLPQTPNYAFAAYLQPARWVGGDFYDVVELDEEHVGLLMADVADKGFHAALFMAVTRTLFLQEGKRSLSPAAVAQAVHQGMLTVSSTNDIFVTAFYGVLHCPSGRLTYIRAAQERPLLYRPGQPVLPLAGGGRFLGMLEELLLEEYTIHLCPGDRLVLFSDGVPDACNLHDVQYGNQQLTMAVAESGHLSAQELVRYLATDVSSWCQSAPLFDDLTLLVVEVKAEA
jgi:serine phosphatase RsbU (regulator of sigma subunit)